jgi:hypothetical protein
LLSDRREDDDLIWRRSEHVGDGVSDLRQHRGKVLDDNERHSDPVDEGGRFTGHGTAELMDLVHAGILEQLPGRRACQLTAASLRAWMANRDPDETSARAGSEPPEATPLRPFADGAVP